MDVTKDRLEAMLESYTNQEAEFRMRLKTLEVQRADTVAKLQTAIGAKLAVQALISADEEPTPTDEGE
ncbi:hypothetical protein H8E07_15100 [bacterium]|nr:hypothetical protein [bacterium]